MVAMSLSCAFLLICGTAAFLAVAVWLWNHVRSFSPIDLKCADALIRVLITS